MLDIRQMVCLPCGMKKQQALDLFDGKVARLAEAIGITSQSVSGWPDVLSDKLSDRVIAAAVRSGKDSQRLRILAQRNSQKRRAA